MSKLRNTASCALKALRSLFSGRIRFSQETIVISAEVWGHAPVPQTNSGQYHVVVCEFEQIDPTSYPHIIACIGAPPHSLLAQLPNLKWLQIPSHGANGYDARQLYAHSSVSVSCLKDVYNESIAQFCIAAYYLMNSHAICRKLLKGRELAACKLIERSTKVLIYGAGSIGTTLAQKCNAMGWRVYGVRRTIPQHKPECFAALCTMSEAEAFLSDIDLVVNLLPETDDTTGIFNMEFFAKCHPNACFCNAGRGSAVVDEDLNKALRAGLLKGGVVLDAATPGKRRDPRIFLTEHYSWKTRETEALLYRYLCSQLELFLRREMPRNIIALRKS